jgi:hypothetical protein
MILAASIIFAAAPRGVAAAEALHLDFENEDDTSMNALVQLDRPTDPDAVRRDCTVARNGRCSQRFEVYSNPAHVAHGAYRAEAHTLQARDLRFCQGSSTQLRFSLRMSRGWSSVRRGMTASIFQFKRTGHPPDAFILVRDNRLALRVGSEYLGVVLEKLPRDQWLDVVLEAKWSVESTGQIDVSITRPNGHLLSRLKYAGPTLRGTEGYGYVKWGTYKPDWEDQPGAASIVWFDEILLAIRGNCA